MSVIMNWIILSDRNFLFFYDVSAFNLEAVFRYRMSELSIFNTVEK